MSRFFVEPHQVDEKTIDITNKEDINHLKRALRHKVGDELEVSDGNKWEYICRIENIEDERVILSIIHKQPFSRESRFEVTLFQGMPKSGKMDLIIQKAVELGATRIQPVYMSRTIVVDKGKDDKKQMRWQKISDEAAKQCKRGKLPDVGLPINFKDAVKDLQAFDYVIFPYENEGKTTMKDALLDIEMTSKGRKIGRAHV